MDKKRCLTANEKKQIIAFMDKVCQMPRKSKVLPEYLKDILWTELTGIVCDFVHNGIKTTAGFELIKGGKND